jgi:subtilisin family serine protease
VPQSYLLISNTAFPSNINLQISRAGGTVTNRIPEAGIIVVSSDKPKFAAGITGAAVVKNVEVRRSLPKRQVALEQSEVNENIVNPPNNDGTYDPLYGLQWGLDAVNAPEAWAAGSTGAGVRVAVLDTGFNLDHPDIKPNINFDLSVDKTGEGLAYGPNSEDPTGIFSHGTHVAGIIAGARNGVGIMGVAPNAELVLVKVLHNDGHGSFEDTLAGIIYAADVGVDVINLSLGASFWRPDELASDVAALRVAETKAINYANRKGATVIVAAGNDAINFNNNHSLFSIYADIPNVLAVSATGPIGWGLDPTTSLDRFASYSNYGSPISFAAPGGDFVYPGSETCSIAGVSAPCFAFDLVFSAGGKVNGANRYFWSAGTSMAAPHAAGVAALIIGNNGGSMSPARVKSAMAQRSADLGKKGQDPYYGFGRVSSGY